jgi:tetratricopeptide (TPR) repeat protein
MAASHVRVFVHAMVLAGCVSQADAALRQARLLAQEGRQQQALAVLNAVRDDAVRSDLHAQAGELALSLGDAQAAMSAFRTALALNPSSVRPEALAMASLLSNIAPPTTDFADISLSSAARLQRGSPDDASAVLKLLPPPLVPPSPAIEFLRGSALLMSRPELAKTHFRSLADNTTSPHGYYGLARVAAFEGDEAACIAALREAKRRWGSSFPANAVAHDSAFAFLAQSGEFASLVTP